MRAGLAHQEASDAIPFFCECARERCYQPVWLTKGEYDSRRPRARWRPIAEEHDVADDTPGLGRTATGSPWAS
jgi:hypothetical protein